MADWKPRQNQDMVRAGWWGVGWRAPVGRGPTHGSPFVGGGRKAMGVSGTVGKGARGGRLWWRVECDVAGLT